MSKAFRFLVVRKGTEFLISLGLVVLFLGILVWLFLGALGLLRFLNFTKILEVFSIG